jgi:UPF0755 protein
VDRSTDEEFDDHPLFGAQVAERTEPDLAGEPRSAEQLHAVLRAEADSRSARRTAAAQRRRKRRRQLVAALAVLAVAAVVFVGVRMVGTIGGYFSAPDYAGTGHGFARVRVNPGDTANNIGDALVSAGVVRSTRAFANAAKASGHAGDIQPGIYRMPLRSSGANAVAAILDPANRLVSKVTVPEGYIANQVFAEVAKQLGTTADTVSSAAKNLGQLGLPADFHPASVEGFLFPATYEIDPDTSAQTVLQSMVTKFSAEYAALNMAAGAKALNLNPYQVLIIASIAEAEAKFAGDRAKVARVILNRLATKSQRLQVDATSAYAAKLAGKAPNSVIYATLNTPYNSYTHPGLPPTPIGNPGESSIKGALNPPVGPWMYYVNVDPAGHLGFFSDDASFERAKQLCIQNKWGCG